MTEDEKLDAAVRRILIERRRPDPEQFRNRLAMFLIFAYLVQLPLLVWKTIPDGNKEIINYILGQISGMATTVVGYYFISKVGEAALDRQRVENTSKLTDLAAAALNAPAGGEPQPVTVVNSEDDAIPVEQKK